MYRQVSLRLTMIAICFGTAMLMSQVNVRAQDNIPAKTLKDVQQDEHMANNDSRINYMLSEIRQRDAEVTALQNRINDVESQTMAIKYFGMGAFTILGILQTLGLIKQLRGK